jgi:hypothetical protein
MVFQTYRSGVTVFICCGPYARRFHNYVINYTLKMRH